MYDTHSIPRLSDVQGYLRFHGWVAQEPGPAGTLWSNGDARIGVPGEQDDELLRGVIDRLALFQRTTTHAVSTGIKHLRFDVTHIRIDDRGRVTDKIPLDTAAKIITSARTMLRATATTARHERAQIGSNYLQTGDAVVRESFMGHTEEGSFIIPILVPIPEIENPDLHEPLIALSHDGAENHIAPPEPFERRVVRTFAQSMQAMRDIVIEPDSPPTADQLVELVYLGVSREFCRALTDILEQDAVAQFETAVEWSPTIPAPKPLTQRVQIDAEANDLVKIVAERLSRQREPSRQVFSGMIVQLRHDRIDDPYGVITVSTIRRNRQSEISVRLPIQRYREAWDWHNAGRAVLVEGEIRQVSRRSMVENPVRCQPLDDLFADV